MTKPDTDKIEEVRARVEAFMQNYLNQNQKNTKEGYQFSREAPQLLSIAKKILFGENGDEAFKLQQSYQKYLSLSKSIAFLVEEVMGLTPEEYEAIYSTSLNETASLEHSIRLLAKACPDKLKEEAIYDTKRILFASCWPEYYAEHFKPVTDLDIFLGRGDCVSILKRVGNVKEAKLFLEKEREDYRKEMGRDGELTVNDFKRFFGIPYEEDEEDRMLEKREQEKKEKRKKNGDPYKQKESVVSYNYGAGVDKIVYRAMRECLPVFVMDTRTLFRALALPKESDFKNYGFTKIIEGRGCYDSPLDFYFLNSPVSFQMENFELYLETRKFARLPESKTLNTYSKIFEKRKALERERNLERVE